MVCSLFKKQLREKSVFDQKEGHSFADSIFDDARPGVKFCVSDIRQSQEWRWKAGRILA